MSLAEWRDIVSTSQCLCFRGLCVACGRCLLSSSATAVVSLEKHVSQAAGLLLYSESLPTFHGYLLAKEGDALIKMPCECFLQTDQRGLKELHQQVYFHRVGKKAPHGNAIKPLCLQVDSSEQTLHSVVESCLCY